jgi:D-alanyl-D-alanine carboxypeptidase
VNRALRIAGMFFGLAALTGVARADTPDAIAKVLAGFKGTVVVATADKIVWTTPTPSPPCPQDAASITLCHPRNPGEVEWPWASVTKQVIATLVMQQVEAGRIALDAPASRYLSGWSEELPTPTVRQLLQHRAGLRNPNDSALDAAGSPSFYTSGPNGLSWCLTGRATPGGKWQYNNCDYIVLGAMLKRVTKIDIARLFARDIARPLGLKQARLVGRGDSAPNLVAGSVMELAPYGAAGALVGTPNELITFDRALLAGKLLKPETRAAMWTGDPALGFMALGQWSFEAKPKGCTAPLRIVERRGGIGKTQVRNILLPDRGVSVIVFLNDPDFDFGEIWQGKGLSHDLLAAAACAP